MPLLGHGHYQDQPDVLAYTARCDSCPNEAKWTSAVADPEDDLHDMDWMYDGVILLCSDCNPKAPGRRRADVPAAFYPD